MNTAELNGKQYTITTDGDKLVLTPVVEKAQGLWKAAEGIQHWYVNIYGEICDGKYMTGKSQKFGNVFPTKESATLAAELMRRSNIFISAALQADPDAGERTNERRFSVGRSDEVPSFEVRDCWLYSMPAYVHTKEQAEDMLRILTAEGWK